MGLGTNHSTTTTQDKWIPEQWEDEAIATYMAKTVMRNHVDVNQHAKHKGDTIHIPNPGRGDASAKAASTQVTLIADTAGEITVSINKHYEYSKLYEDLADMLALNGMKKFYTKDAGYALARRVDAELHKIMATMQGGSIAGATNLFEKAVIGGDGSTNFSGASSGNGTALTDPGLRRAMQTLEDSDVDTSECVLVVPPTVIKTLRGIARFTEQAFVGDGTAIKTGRVGNLYGVEVFASSLCPWIHCNSVTNTQSVNFSSTTLTTSYVDEFGFTVDWATSTPTDTKYRACALIHPDAMTLYEAQGVRVQQQYKQEYLGYLVTADNVFGAAELRDYGAISLIVPA
jgi:N4-gp56 family major capsid protein